MSVLKIFFVCGCKIEQVKGKGKQEIFYLVNGNEFSHDGFFMWKEYMESK